MRLTTFIRRWRAMNVVSTAVDPAPYRHTRWRQPLVAQSHDCSLEEWMPTIYHITVQGHLDAQWSTWFDGLTITNRANGEALLVGPVLDQAALHGLLVKIRDLGLPLVAVMPENKPENDGTGNRDPLDRASPVAGSITE